MLSKTAVRGRVNVLTAIAMVNKISETGMYDQEICIACHVTK
jgi:hypothetical protein